MDQGGAQSGRASHGRRSWSDGGGLVGLLWWNWWVSTHPTLASGVRDGADANNSGLLAFYAG